MNKRDELVAALQREDMVLPERIKNLILSAFDRGYELGLDEGSKSYGKTH